MLQTEEHMQHERQKASAEVATLHKHLRELEALYLFEKEQRKELMKLAIEQARATGDLVRNPHPMCVCVSLSTQNIPTATFCAIASTNCSVGM